MHKMALVFFFLLPFFFSPAVATPAENISGQATSVQNTDNQKSVVLQRAKRVVAGDDAAKAPVKGDMLVLGLGAEPSNLLPRMATDVPSSQVSDMMHVGLLRYGKDLEVEPWAAESFEVLDDGLRLRFVLRRGIRWSDGVELTADDVEFTYLTMINPSTPTAYAADFKMVTSFTKLDRYTIEMRYEKPYPRSLNTWMGGILPKHVLEGENLRSTIFSRNPLSSGPYLLQEWKGGTQISFVSNPDYFEGQPYIDRVLYRFIPDSTTQFLELKAGNIDVLPSLSPSQYVYQSKSPELFEKYNTYQWLDFTYSFLAYNLKSSLFSDVRVRKALAHATNKQDIIKGAVLGQGLGTVGPYRPGTWVYNTELEDYAFDLDRARALLEEAGWKRGKDGSLNKDNIPFSFTLLVPQGKETTIKTAVILQSQLQQLGIEVKIRTVEWAAYINQFIAKGFFDATLLAWTVPLDPDAAAVWHSKASPTLNFMGYANAEVDALLEAASSTFDRKERKRLYDRFQEILHDEQPYRFLYVPYVNAAVSKRLHGIEQAPQGIFYNSEKWWVPLKDQRYRLQIQ